MIPEEKLKPGLTINLAPMIDFVFLMLACFATLAVTRITLYDTQIDLVKLRKEMNSQMVQSKDECMQIHLSVSKNSKYKWITEIQDYPMESLEKIQNELFHHYHIGILPQDKSKTQVLLHIDKDATWEDVAKLIFAIRETGFNPLPVYKPSEK
jgi:biopolymer transport protein ExbD